MLGKGVLRLPQTVSQDQLENIPEPCTCVLKKSKNYMSLDSYNIDIPIGEIVYPKTLNVPDILWLDIKRKRELEGN